MNARPILRLALLGAIPVAFVLIVILFHPFRYLFEIDPDEGVNAMKAFLLERGYRLYYDIWSDQPPVFTYLLAGWFRVVGENVLAGRLFVLAFSAGLVALAATSLRRVWGLLGASLAALFLILLPFYAQLSVSIMIGLPAIVLAFSSLWCLLNWHEDRRTGWLILSSLLLALSILTKLFTAVLIPVWFLGILFDPRAHSPHSSGRLAGWKAAFLWLSVLAALGGLVVFGVVGPQNLGQLVDAHLASSGARGLSEWAQSPSLGTYLGPSLPILLLAVVGTYRGIVSGKRMVLYLAGWMVGGGLFLILNRPTWYHHQLLITVPAAILAAIAVASALRDLVSWRRRPPAPLDRLSIAVTLVLLATVLLRRVPDTLETLDLTLPNLGGPPPMVSEEQEILALMWNHAAETDWVYTDRPIFAFAIGRPVPPRLAVLTEKRLVTGNLTGSQILSELETYSPRMILEGQFDIPAVDEYMFTRNFARLDSTVGYRLYLKPSVP